MCEQHACFGCIWPIMAYDIDSMLQKSNSCVWTKRYGKKYKVFSKSQISLVPNPNDT